MFKHTLLHKLLEGIPKYFLYRVIYISSIGLALLLLCWVLLHHYNIKDALLSWDIYQETNILPLTPYSHNVAGMTLSQELYTFLPKTWYVGRHYIINEDIIYYGFLSLIFLALNILLASINSWKKYLFYFGQLLVMLVLFSFRGDNILLFNSINNYFFVIAVSLFLGFNYIFKFLFTHTSWLTRFLLYAFLTILIGIIVHYWSGISHPFHSMVVSSLSVVIPIIVGVIIFLAVEISYTILRYSNSFASFAIVSLAYAVLVLITLITKSGLLVSTFLPINAIILLFISCILGLWNFHKKINLTLFGDVLSVKMIYVAMLLVLSGFYFFIIQRGNKLIFNVLDYTILIVFMSSAVIFILYSIFNYYELFMQKKQVYKVVYKPKRVPYYIFLATVILISLVSMRAYDSKLFFNILSGYYNERGDFYLSTGKNALAKDAYIQSSREGNMNAHANYARGVIEMNNQNNQEAMNLFRLTNQIEDLPQNYVNMGIINTWNGSHTLSISHLKKANQLFPHNPYVKNNLGLEYAYFHMLDSASYFLIPNKENQANASYQQEMIDNFVGMLIETKADILDKSDWMSLDSIYNKPQIKSRDTNLLLPSTAKVAYLNAFPTENYGIDYKKLIQNAGSLQPYQLANGIVYAITNKKTLSKDMEDILDNVVVDGGDELWFSKCYALWLFANQKYEKAFLKMMKVASKYSEYNAKANQILGTWSLVLNAPRLGQSFFRHIQQYIDPAVGYRKLLSAYLSDDKEDKKYYDNLLKEMTNNKKSSLRYENVFDNFDKKYIISRQQEGEPNQELLVNTPNLDAFNVAKLSSHIKILVEDKKIKEAYDLVLEKLSINKYNLKLNELYITLAAQQGYWFFIEKEKEGMVKIFGAKEYNVLIQNLKEQYPIIDVF